MCHTPVVMKSMAKFILFLVLLIQRIMAYHAYGTTASSYGNPDQSPSNGINGNSGNPHDKGYLEDLCPSGVEKQIDHCSSELASLASGGYPWMDAQHLDIRDRPLGNGTIKDPMDVLDRICQAFSRFQTCFAYHRIADYCLLIRTFTSKVRAVVFHLKTAFDFICRRSPRNVDTAHSLQCLSDTRVLSVLEYHIGKDCVHGPGILENQMRVFKAASFYGYDLPAASYNIPPVMINQHCLPKEVIEGCAKYIVERKCGASTAAFVEAYLKFQIGENAKAVSDVGLTPVHCDLDPVFESGNYESSDPGRANPDKRFVGQRRLPPVLPLSKESTGTGLDTVFGRRLLSDLQKKQNMCDKVLLFSHYEACLLFSDARTEPPKYNILQSAHQLLKLLTQGTECSRLAELVSCWDVHKQVCGPATRGFEHDFILQTESCNIQQYMESIQCDWQDMLFEVYIEAAQKTVWPLASQSGHPLYLDNATYELEEVVKSFERFIQLLQPGVNRLASRCGDEAAERLQKVYEKLSYSLADVFILKAEIHV